MPFSPLIELARAESVLNKNYQGDSVEWSGSRLFLFFERPFESVNPPTLHLGFVLIAKLFQFRLDFGSSRQTQVFKIFTYEFIHLESLTPQI